MRTDNPVSLLSAFVVLGAGLIACAGAVASPEAAFTANAAGLSWLDALGSPLSPLLVAGSITFWLYN